MADVFKEVQSSQVKYRWQMETGRALVTTHREDRSGIKHLLVKNISDLGKVRTVEILSEIYRATYD